MKADPFDHEVGGGTPPLRHPMIKLERTRAEQISAAVDQALNDAQALTDSDDVGLANTVRQLIRLPSLLGPVDPAFEQRIMRRVQARATRVRARPRLGFGWAAASLAALALLVTLLTPAGQTVLASFLAVFDLGRTEVHITPVDTGSIPSTTAVAQGTAVELEITLAEAQGEVSFAIPRPTYLPLGYRLLRVKSYTYPDLPPWVPQPFFLELVYVHDSGKECSLRLYPITLGDKASISRLNLQAAPIQTVEDVDVNGQPGVLLRLGTERIQGVWQEVVWEQGDLILALSAADLAEEELLRVARSVE